MDYGFKPTTNGRALLAACAATGDGLEITRVAVGKGELPVGIDLADVHALYDYVTDGSISLRSHADDRFNLTVQYSNAAPASHQELPTFFLREFMVYARHPETGEETDLLYATLGDYYQTVPAYNARYSPSVFSFPLTIVISDEINVTIDATAGLVTYDDLVDAVKEETRDNGGIVKTILFEIPVSAWGNDGSADYPYAADVADEDVTQRLVPMVILDDDCINKAVRAKLCPTVESHTEFVRFKAGMIPAGDLHGTLYLIGKATGGGGGGGGYELPTATATRLGGIKIGNGLNVQRDGTASIDNDDVNDIVNGNISSDADVQEMIDEVWEDDGPEGTIGEMVEVEE